MSKPKPSVGRGRARGRLRQDGSPGISPVGLRQLEVIQSDEQSTTGRTLDSPQRQVCVNTSDDDESRLKKNPRPRSKRPEVQLYVPRGRRSQDTGSNDHNLQSKENSPESISSQNDVSRYRNDTAIIQSTKDVFDNEKQNAVNDSVPKPYQEKPRCENDKLVPNASRQRRARTNQIYVPPGRRKDEVQTQSQSSPNQNIDGERLGIDEKVTDLSSTQQKNDVPDLNERDAGTRKTSSDMELWEVDDSIVAMSESCMSHNQNKYCEKAEVGRNREEEKQVHSLPVQSNANYHKLNNQKYDIESYSHETDLVSYKDGDSQTKDKCMPTNIQSCQIINVEQNLSNSDIPSLKNENDPLNHRDSSSFSNVVSETESKLKDLMIESDLTNTGQEDSTVHSETENTLQDLTIENHLSCPGHEDLTTHNASEHLPTDIHSSNRNHNSLHVSADTVTLQGNDIISQDGSTVDENLCREHFDERFSSDNGNVSQHDVSSRDLSPDLSDLCASETLAKDDIEITEKKRKNYESIKTKDELEEDSNKLMKNENSSETVGLNNPTGKESALGSVKNVSKCIEDSLESNIPQSSDSSQQKHDTSDSITSEMTRLSDTSISNTKEGTSVSNTKDDTSVSNKNDDTSLSKTNNDTSVLNKNDDASGSKSNDDTSVSNLNVDPSSSHAHDTSDSLSQTVTCTDECNIILNVENNSDMSEGPSPLCSKDTPNSSDVDKSVCQEENSSMALDLTDTNVSNISKEHKALEKDKARESTNVSDISEKHKTLEKVKAIESTNVSDISKEHKALEKDKATESTTHGLSTSTKKCNDKVKLNEPNVKKTGGNLCDKKEQRKSCQVAAKKEASLEKGEKMKKTTKKKTPKIGKKLKKKLEEIENSDTAPGEDSQTSANTDQVIKSTDDSDDEESWDNMFDDDGDCLDPSLVQELTGNVGKVKVKKPVINYLNYQPKEPDMDYEGMNHVIEIFDFSPELKTEDLLSAFSQFKSKGFDIKWVDDTHALGVFSSVIAANEALQYTHPLLKVGPLSQACRQSKLKAKRAVEFLQPYKPRPETTAVVARRMLTGALGLKTKVSKEQREKEREEKQKLKQAKEKKKKEKQQQMDIWEGNVASNVKSEEETWIHALMNTITLKD